MKGILTAKGATAVNTTASALLTRAQTGDSAAFGELYGLFAAELYRYACAILKNPQDAEDIVQETCIKVYTNIKNIRNPEHCKAYFFKVLSNTAKTHLRRKSLAPLTDPFPEAMQSSEDTEQTAVERSDLQTALAALSEEERQIVLLSAVAGLRSREIAETIGLTAGGVRSKLSRALRKMRSSLSEQEAQPK